MNNIFKNKGFTLIEIMVAVVIMSLAVIFIYETFISQHKSYLVQEEVTTIQQDVRVAMDMMTRDIRMSGVGLDSGTNAVNVTSTSPYTVEIKNSLSTYLTASADNGSTMTITVPSSNGFKANDNINILSFTDKSTRNSNALQISSVASTSITFQTTDGTDASTAFGGGAPSVGDLVVKNASVIYSLSGGQLSKDGAAIADNISSLSVDTSDPSNIAVQLTSQTSKEVSKLKGAARTRQMTSRAMVKNKNL